MLLALLYHQVGKGKHANPLPLLEKHFAWISASYKTVHPEEMLPKKGICLTFDDATADFYFCIFPLLKKYSLKAVLSVPTAYILENSRLKPEHRIAKIGPVDLKLPPIPSPAFCTWEELRAMQASGLVHIASHSINHRPLTSSKIDPLHEIATSKIILEKKLCCPISTFTYPFGQFNSSIHALAKSHYSTIMRIGNAANLSWKNTNQLFYRIPADQLTHPHAPFGVSLYVKSHLGFLLNTLRKK